MVYIPPSVLLGGAQLLSGGINTFFNNQSRRAQLKAERQAVDQANKYRLAAFGRELEDVAEYNEAIREAFEQSKETARRQIAANNNAYQDVISSGLTRLADESDNYIAKAMGRKIGLAEATGRTAASGVTGVTADRMDTVQRAAAGRATAADLASKERSIGAYLFNVQQAREATEFANYSAYVPVSRAPRLAKAPMFEGFASGPVDTTGLGLTSDLISTGINTLGAYFGNLPKKATK